MKHLRDTSQPPLTFGGWLRHDFVARALDDIPLGARVLEIGPGLGSMGVRLARTLQYVAVEPDRRSREHAQDLVSSLNGRVVSSLDQVEGLFEAVCAFEVLEHIEDDAAALHKWVSYIESDGLFIASVPAGPGRMGPWDRSVGHHRRYSIRTFSALLESAGLGVVTMRSIGYPVGYVSEWIRNRLVASEHDRNRDMDARTARSGRLLQTNENTATLVRLLSIPQRRLTQMMSPQGGLGTGLLGVGVKR